MGLLSIANHLTRNGVPTSLLHLGVERSVDPRFDLVRYVERTAPRVVAFSIHWFFQLTDTAEVARRIKECVSQTIVVAGGFTASLFAEELVAGHHGIDGVIRGDGEQPLLELCRRVAGGARQGWSGVPNLIWRSSDDRVVDNGLVYVPQAAELSQMRFSDFGRFIHHPEFLELTGYPTRRFRKRFGDGGLFILETGRGCPYYCLFCGGGRHAQARMSGRRAPVFRSIESVLETIREAAAAGYRNLFVCFDPDLEGEYYRELFRRLRRDRLELRCIFGSWGLPSPALVEEMGRCFTDTMFEISPETSDDELRLRNMGRRAFTNEQLDDRLELLRGSGSAVELFFGYFLAGDTTETVMRTLDEARRRDNEWCESYYLAYSTDPGSGFHLWPEECEVTTTVSSLDDYLQALDQPRATPNMLAHRPAEMAQEEAGRLVAVVTGDELLHKVLPCSYALLQRLVGGGDRWERAAAGIRQRLGREAGEGAGTQPARGVVGSRSELGVEEVVRGFVEVAEEILASSGGGQGGLIGDLEGLEALPYLLLEEGRAGQGRHYGSFCEPVGSGPAERALLGGAPGVETTERSYSWNVTQLLEGLRGGEQVEPRREPVRVFLAIDRVGRYAITEIRGE